MKKNEIYWVDGLFRIVRIGFCPNKKAWKKLMKELEIKNEPYPTGDGRITHFESKKKNINIALLTVSDNDRKDQILGLIVHECVHITQILVEAMNDKAPSEEFAAYTTQHFFLEMVEAYEATRGKLI